MNRKPKSALRSEREALRRDVLPQGRAEPSIKPVTIDWDLARETRVFSGTDLVWSLNMEQIKRESPEHHQIIYDLLVLLHKMAAVARDAVPVAAVELGIDEKRDIARERLKKKARDRDVILTAEARKLLAKNPRLTTSDLARQLSDRGHGGAEGIRKRLPTLLG